MTPTFTLLDETFHALAQPIMALRATVELGLARSPESLQARQVLSECLQRIDELTQVMAVTREIASVVDAPSLAAHNGEAILRGCVKEMSPVAHEHEVLIHLNATAAAVECDERLLQQAVFVLLDAMLPAMPRGGEIQLQLTSAGEHARLHVEPMIIRGPRQKLCRRLMQAAGGRAADCPGGGLDVLFRATAARQTSPPPLAAE